MQCVLMRLRNAEVRGSIPLCSTNNSPPINNLPSPTIALVECGGQGVESLGSSNNAHRFNDLPAPNFGSVECGGQGFEPPSTPPIESSTYGDCVSCLFRFRGFLASG